MCFIRRTVRSVQRRLGVDFVDVVPDNNYNGMCDADSSSGSETVGIDETRIQIRWENRYRQDNGSRCLVSVDGTDFRINEPSPFSSKWFSPKFNKAALRYEVGICIQTGDIVWINGPYPPGEWNDLQIALDGIVYLLEGDERLITDKGYRGYPVYFDCQWRYLDNQHQKTRKALARARHENVNKLFKDWDCLSERWRCDLALHGVAFRAVANIVQFKIEQSGHEGVVWQLECNDRINNEPIHI